MLRFLIVASLFFCGLAHAQYPTINWQHQAETMGDGTRSYVLRGQNQNAFYDPGLDPRYVVPADDGAYLILPVNTASGSDYLQFLYTPFHFATRGHQIVKLNAQGGLVWKRFLAFADETERAIATQEMNINSGLYATQLASFQARVTGSGGLAFLSGAGYLVFSAQGQILQSTSSYCDNLLDYAITQTELNDEGILVAWSSGSGAAAERACAIDTNGAELGRLSFPAGATVSVADYRRNVGFLTKSGNYSLGNWSNAILALQTGSTTLWSKTGAAANNFGAFFQPAIAPNGEVWTYYNQALSKFDSSGTTVWQRNDVYSAVRHFLNDGSALLELEFPNSWLALNADGTTRWERPLPNAYFVAAPRIEPDSLHVLQLESQTNALLAHAINLNTGAMTTGRFVKNTENPLLTIGSLSASQFVQVEYRPSVLSRSYNGSCNFSGFFGDCVRLLQFTQPFARIRSAQSGVDLATVDSLPWPLPSMPLATRSWIDLEFDEDGSISRRYVKHLVHDGIRSRLQIQKLEANGQKLWSTTLATPNYDAGAASFYNFGALLLAGAKEYAPRGTASIHRLWALNQSDGSIAWQLPLTSPWQRIDRVTSGTPPVSEACGLTELVSNGYRIECATLTGQLRVSQAVQNVPALSRLVAVARDSSSSLRARVLPNDADIESDRFLFVSINLAGQLNTHSEYSFAPPNGTERIRADALVLSQLGNARLATGAVAATATSSQYSALLVAKFDINGTRLWQTRINTPMRGFFQTGESTSIVETSLGRVFVAFHPRRAPNEYPTQVCELASNTGALLSCADLPTNGRVTHLIPVGNRLHVWMNTSFDGGLALYELENGAFLPRSLFVGNSFARTNTGINGDGESRYYLTLQAYDGDASSSVRYVEVQYAPAAFGFKDGFE